MTKKDIEEAVIACVKAKHPLLSEDSRKFVLEVGLRCITIKWCKHTLQWMIKCFEKKSCCILDRVIDTTEIDTSILDTVTTIQKITTQRTTTSSTRRTARRKSAASPSSLELKAAFFMVRRLVP